MIEDKMRYWRYCDELSVVDAALLIVGLNPGDVELQGRPIEEARLIQLDLGGEDLTSWERDFRAVFKALRYAILRDKLSANIARICRKPSYQWIGGRPTAQYLGEGEQEFIYDGLLVAPERLFSTSRDMNAGYEGKIYYIQEPDWFQTTVVVDHLKSWIASKGDRPSFFYPDAKLRGFEDEYHDRYSPKLAAVVAAWEAVEEPPKGRTVKQTLERWLREHAAHFGLVHDDGSPRGDVIADLAKVANWHTKGGAPKTASSGTVDENSRPNSNFSDLGKDGVDTIWTKPSL